MIALYVLKNRQGMLAAITSHGAKLVSLMAPDMNGKLIDVVTGFECVDGYPHPDNGPGILRPGKKSFRDVIWNASQPNENSLELTYFSKDPDVNLSGNLEARITYKLTDDSRLMLSCEVSPNKIKEANLVSRPLFNLNGAGSGSILNHIVQINADNFITVDKEKIPTGKIETVSASPFDFRKATTIGARINDNNEQLRNGKGYDHNFVLNKHSSRTPVARIKGDKSGILMEVCTGERGLFFYSGNSIQSKNNTKENKKDDFRAAFAMETNYFPDPGNQQELSAAMFYPGQNYKSVTIYRFKTGK